MKSTRALQFLVLVIASVVLLFPFCMFLFSTSFVGQQVSVPHESLAVIVRTFLWALGIGISATAIGWPVGLRIATCQRSVASGVVLLVFMSRALPAYAVYYAWWQAWPAGSWLHNSVVQHGMLAIAMKVCVFMALVGWSWPIPALIATMSNRERNGLALLHSVDGTSFVSRFWNRFRAEKRMLVISVILVGTLTAANTTCFDLAQISTIGNELRAVLSAGGSIISAPWLTISGIIVACVASMALIRCTKQHQHQTIVRAKSLVPVVLVWVLLTGGPLTLSAFASLRGDGFQLWSQYGGDLLVSATIAIAVAILISLIGVSSMALHLSESKKIRLLANGMDVVWILVACVPASLVAAIVGHAWHVVNLDYVDRSPLLLILGQVARIGFVGSLAGRWVASCPRTMGLYRLDHPRSISSLLCAVKPRLLLAMSVALALSIAMSLGEVALTTQLAPPSSNQPISVALLNAMHYQRPQIVTSTLFVMVLVAGVGGLCLFLLNRKCIVLLFICCVLVSCTTQNETPILDARIIGSAGNSDGHFVTPRAIDSDNQVIVVIDKSGRLQRYSHEGTFISSWDLELSGTGFPTGVSIDEDGNIWIADTHQHRILVLDTEGETVLEFGEYGTGEGQFLYPTDIAFGLNGEVFVSEYGGNDRVSVFTRDGEFLRSLGHHGESRTGFRRPQSIAIDRSTGYLYVADSGNHRIVVLKPDGEVVNIISEVGRQNSEVLYPYGILMDTPNTFIVCEFGNNRLQRFSIDGESLELWGSAGDGAGFLRTPWGIAVTKNGIVVADTGNNRLQLLPDMMTN